MWTSHDIFLFKYHFLLHILRFLFFFSDNIMADVASKQQPTALFLSTTVTRTRRHKELTKKLTNLIGNLCCAREHSVQFFVQSLFTQLNCTVKLCVYGTLNMASLALSASLPVCGCRWLYEFSFLSHFQHSAFRYWQVSACWHRRQPTPSLITSTQFLYSIISPPHMKYFCNRLVLIPTYPI